MPRLSKSRKHGIQKAKKMHLVMKFRRKLLESKGEDHNPTTFAENVDNSVQIDASIGLNDCRPDLCIKSREEDTIVSASNQKTREHQIQVETSPETQQVPSRSIEGRRIIDIAYFYSELKNIDKHGVFNCGLQSVDIVGERQVGLHSLFTLKCRMCNETFYVENDNPTKIHINSCAVAGTIATGCGHSQLQELSAALDLPLVSHKTYKKYHCNLSNYWEKTSVESMTIAAQKEREVALAEGRVDKDGIPVIDVIVDGCWSKRTYKKNYSALSGAASIIGKKTGKVLFLGVKNKYCSLCAYAQKNKQEPKIHKCYKNYYGSSTAMESDILVEGFRCSIDMHNLIYGRMVSDGDSSTYSKLLKSRPYPHITIEKIECRNHILRNLCNKLAALQSDTKYLLKYRKIITQKKIMILRSTIRKIINTYKADNESQRRSNIEPLYNDILVAHLHSFNEHSRCKPFFCDVGSNTQKETPEFYTSTLWSRICGLMSNLASQAPSLIHDIDSNRVESYNSIIAKLVGGKRINFSKRGSYQMRCHAAVVSFNTHRVISTLYKSMSGRSPRGSLAKLEKRRMEKKMMMRRIQRKKNRKLFSKGEDSHYGRTCEKPDMLPEMFEKTKKTFLQDLIKTKEEKEIIQRETILQSSCNDWLELRRNLLTASNFGKVIKRRNDISCHNLVRDILYKESIAHVKSIKHGRENENKALRQLEIQEGVKISPCGLFIDEKHNYLGATPDGMIDDDTVVEIKCPLTVYEKDLYAMVKSKKLPCYKLDSKNDKLIFNKKHIWFYQIQGQLHIANKLKCLFAIWSGESKDIKIEWILRDDNVWKREMEPKLVSFYMECLLPELVDPRFPRNMRIRDPIYVQEAIKEKEKKKNIRKRTKSDQENEERNNEDIEDRSNEVQNKKQKTDKIIQVLAEQNERVLKFTDF